MFLSKMPVFPLLWIFIQLGTEVFTFRVELKPKNALFRVGAIEKLQCSVKDCADKLTISWGMLEDKPMPAQIHTDGPESEAIFDPVMLEHEGTILQCKASCGHLRKAPRAVVKVYSFPTDPVISGHDRLILGQENSLECRLTNVYPAELLTIDWLRGEEVLQSRIGDTGPGSALSTYTLTPTKEDTGREITCRATLNRKGVPAEESVREATASLTVLYAPHIVGISESAVVNAGSPLSLSCFAEGNPTPATEWTFTTADGQESIGQNKELVFEKVTASQSGEYRCVVSNTLGNQTATVKVTVRARPSNTTISLSPGGEVMEGESVTVSCVSDGAPVERMVLGRVNEEYRYTEPTSSDNSSSLSFILSSVALKDSGGYRCTAYNQHGMEWVETQLVINAHPLELELMPRVNAAEKGSSVVLTCRASGCPQPSLSWRNALDTPIHSQTDTQGPVSQLHLRALGLTDEGTYICEATCGSVVQSKHTEVKVFSFPLDPIIENRGSFLEGEEAVLHCTVPDVYPVSRLRIQWLAGDRELQSEVGQYSSILSYQLGPEVEGELLTCRATLEMDGNEVWGHREASTTLQLDYPPRGTSISVSPSGEVKEGESVTISCISDGSPAGRLGLGRVSEEYRYTELTSSDNSSSLSFILSSVALEDSGKYECRASNQHGTEWDLTQLVINAPPRNTTVTVFPSTEVQEGQNVTICCHSVSFPPPAVVLKKLSNGTELYSPDGTFQLVNLTPSDAGLYQVNITNDLGYETEVFTINVMEKRRRPSPGLTDIIVPIVCACAALATLALVLDYVRRSRKRGFYELAKCKSGAA